MNPHSETPFDNIEASHEYVSLLAEAVKEAIAEVEASIALAVSEGVAADRRKDVLQLVHFNLNKLANHMAASRRILNDLRTLRRLLLGERNVETAVHRAGV
jgi:hypothetical protein